MAVEIYKILNGMGPKYLSHLLSRSVPPYNLRDQNKLIHPLKGTTTVGIKPLAYYGTHLWNILPHDVKGALTLNNFRTLIINESAELVAVQCLICPFEYSLPFKTKHMWKWICMHMYMQVHVRMYTWIYTCLYFTCVCMYVCSKIQTKQNAFYIDI